MHVRMVGHMYDRGGRYYENHDGGIRGTIQGNIIFEDRRQSGVLTETDREIFIVFGLRQGKMDLKE